MNEDTVAIRLKLFIEQMGMSNSQFADRCNIPRPSLSQLLTGRNKKISDVFVRQIHLSFPRLNIIWLLFGEGEMLTPAENPELPASDDLKFVSDYEEPAKYGSQAMPPSPFFDVQSVGSEQVASKNASSSSAQKTVSKSDAPRKVTQITVYYDDSTFETFYPGK